MKNYSNNKLNVRLGFSLLELLIVISIIGVLAFMGTAFYIRQLDKSYDARRKTDLSALQNVMEEYEKDHSCYPNLLASDRLVCGSTAGTIFENYISNMPCDPKTDTLYTYEQENNSCPSWYRLFTDLEFLTDADSESQGCGDGACGPAPGYDYYLGSPNAPRP